MSAGGISTFEGAAVPFRFVFRLSLLDDDDDDDAADVVVVFERACVTQFETPNASSPSIIAAEVGYHVIPCVQYALKSSVLRQL